MGMADFLQACRQNVSAFIRLFLRRVAAGLFVLLQTVNLRDPRKRLKDLKTRQGCVIRCKIVLRWKVDLLIRPNSLGDFLLWGDSELSSLDVLLKQDVSLYNIASDLAVFVRTSPGIDCCSSKTFPFFYLAQLLHAEEVYVTSNHWLDVLASEIAEECRVPVTWLHCCGRCGSTMLCQIMERVPGTVCISEPDAFFNVLLLAQSGAITADQQAILLRAALFTLIYHCQSQSRSSPSAEHRGVDHVFIKPRSECSALLLDIHKAYPRIRHVFMYRRQPAFLKSWMSLMAFSDPLSVMLVNSDLVAAVTSRFRLDAFRNVFYASEEHRRAVADLVPGLTYVGIVAAMYCSQLRMILDLQNRGFSLPALLYEDVLADPLTTVGRLFEHLRLPMASLEAALGSMAEPSQRGVPGFFSSRPSSSFPITARERRDMDIILGRFQLPQGEGEEVVFSQRL